MYDGCSYINNEVSTLDPDGSAETEPDGILAVHVIVPPIQSLIEVDLLAVPGQFGLILQKGVPVLIHPIVSGGDLLPIQEELFLPSWFGHRLMHKGLIGRCDIILRGSFPLLHISQVLVP